jgi:hypothetical protein
MANTPNARTSVQATAGAVANGLDLCCILAPCAQAADSTPRRFGGAAAIYTKHGYSEGLEYAAYHVKKTGRPVLFVALPIAVAGVVGRKNTSGNTGSSAVDVVAGSGGCMTEHDGVIAVAKGGVVGTDQIQLDVSLDGGTTFRRVRLGTNNQYTPPYVNVSVTFGAGTLVADDTVITWHGTGPIADSAGWAAARSALAAQQKQFRRIMNIGDLRNHTEGAALLSEVNAYETEDERFTGVRASVLDRLPQAAMSKITVRMSGAPNVTFAEVGGTSDTATRSAGSFVTDGFANGDTVTVTGAVAGAGHNNVTGVLANVSATVLTMGATDFDNEGPIAGVNIVGSPTLTFVASTHTITRNRGSWLDDGFRVGDSVTVTGTVGNNYTKTITGLSATVMTFAAGVVDETISTALATIVAGQDKATWAAAVDAEFATITAAKRINLGLGRGRVLNPFSGWNFRRSVQWAACAREFANDIHITTWRKDAGPTDFDLFDADGNLVEYDDRVDGGAASAGRFTSFRTWGNGPEGAFITLDLTRETDGSILSYQHNMNVTDLVCSIVQQVTENFIGRTPTLADNGSASPEELSALAGEVNSALTLNLLQDKKGQGQRASNVVWAPSADDDLSVPDATLTGSTELDLNGTIVNVNTVVRVKSGGG